MPGFLIVSTVFIQKEMDTNMKNEINCDKIEEASHIISNLSPDKNITEEEFQNFMHRVTEVGRYSYDCVSQIYIFQ